ncbi:MAG: DUF6279 family lipoprotein [Burkholderiales bacterium]
MVITAGRRIASVALFFAVALVLVSCSFTRFAYNQADTFAAWMADDYFDLTGIQKTEFENRFAKFYAWHRQEQLPEYAQFMRTARSKVQDGLTAPEVLWFVDGIRTRYRAMAAQAAPEAAALLATLTPAQVDNLQRRWEKDNRKYVKEHKLNGTLEERQEFEAKRIAKQFKEWLAPLHAEQEQRVMAAVREMPDVSRERYEERVRRQKDFLNLLAQRNEDRQRFQARLTDWLTKWDRNRSAEYQKRLDTVWQKRAELFAALERSFTADQRATSLQRMATYAEDFAHLARRSIEDRTAAR